MHYLAEFPPCQKEFWFVLAGIHLQTNAHVTAAAPIMAHPPLAIHGSRFGFLHYAIILQSTELKILY